MLEIAPLPRRARRGRPAARRRAHGRRAAAPTPIFRRQLADASRRAVVYAADGETAHSAVGAAAAAWPRPPATAASAAAAARAGLETIEPDEARAARWDALWERHEAALRAVRNAGEALS